MLSPRPQVAEHVTTSLTVELKSLQSDSCSSSWEQDRPKSQAIQDRIRSFPSQTPRHSFKHPLPAKPPLGPLPPSYCTPLVVRWPPFLLVAVPIFIAAPKKAGAEVPQGEPEWIATRELPGAGEGLEAASGSLRNLCAPLQTPDV